MTAYNISNSEASTWLACTKRYYYTFDLNLEPVKLSDPLTLGNAGHAVLQTYYQQIKDGVSRAQAQTDALQTLMDLPLEFDILTTLAQIIRNYFTYVDDSDWDLQQVVGVEELITLPLTPEFNYTLRYDLLVVERSTGKTLLVDHKFVYDFWKIDDINLSPQFPKYKAALAANGILVDGCILNQLRYRQIKPENWTKDILFQRTPATVSKAKMRNALDDQIKASRQIVEHRALPLEVRGTSTIRSLNKMTCKYCTVKDLCLAEFDGGDVTFMIQQNYRQNSYGYNKPTISEGDL